MGFIVTEIRRDSSKGSNFKVLFENEVTLENAVAQLLLALSSSTNSPQHHFIREQQKYGYVKLRRGELIIQDERVASNWLRIDGPINDVYRVTENEMDFEQLKNLYRFLESQ